MIETLLYTETKTVNSREILTPGIGSEIYAEKEIRTAERIIDGNPEK